MRRDRQTAHHAVAAVVLLGLLALPGLPGLPGGSGGDEPAAASDETSTAWARLEAADGRLRRGCRDYSYAYALTSPMPDWQLETTIVGPGGVGVAADVILSGADTTTGTKTFRLCRRTNEAGIYRVAGILTYRDYPDTHSVAAQGDVFVLEKVRRKKRR